MDIKVLQYIMGHAHFDVTMEVYNHLGDRARIENEIAKLDSMAVNFWHQKRKIGVKLVSNLRKMTISWEENTCKPLILLGLQKNIKIISTQVLTVLTTSVILQIEQRKGDKKRMKEIPEIQCFYINLFILYKAFRKCQKRNGGMTYDDA